MLPVLTPEEMGGADARAIDAGIPEPVLMERNPAGMSSNATVDPSASCNSACSGYKAGWPWV